MKVLSDILHAKWLQSQLGKLTVATRSTSPVTTKLLTGSMKSKACQSKRGVVDENLLPSKSRSTKMPSASSVKGSSDSSRKKSQPKTGSWTVYLSGDTLYLSQDGLIRRLAKIYPTTSYRLSDVTVLWPNVSITLSPSTPKTIPGS